jgi:hypothetical protein
MAGALLTKQMLKKVEKCICKECSYCHNKDCSGCEKPVTNRMGCITCYPHNPNFIRLQEAGA